MRRDFFTRTTRAPIRDSNAEPEIVRRVVRFWMCHDDVMAAENTCGVDRATVHEGLCAAEVRRQMPSAGVALAANKFY